MNERIVFLFPEELSALDWLDCHKATVTGFVLATVVLSYSRWAG